MAQNWIAMHEDSWNNRQNIVYAVTLKSNSKIIGTVSLELYEKDKAELGYWIGYEYWGKGFCSEVASALVEKAFSVFSISVIIARHLSSNPASGKVMNKIGMVKYLTTRKPDRNGLLSDIEMYKIEK